MASVKIPPGATHQNQDCKFFKVDGEKVYHYCRGYWLLYANNYYRFPLSYFTAI